MTIPPERAPDIEAESNRQLHRRIAGWLGWPLTVLVAFAVGYAVVGQHTSAPETKPPAVTTTLGPSGIQTAPQLAPKPAPTVAPATTGVDVPAPARHAKTKVIQPTDVLTSPTAGATVPVHSAPSTPPPPPAETRPSPAPTSPPPLLRICVLTVCV